MACKDCIIYGTCTIDETEGLWPTVFLSSSSVPAPATSRYANGSKELPEKDRHAVGRDLERVQHRWPVGMPLARPLGKGLWEVRTSLASNRIARVIFCFHEEELVALNGFIKKSQKAPQDELDLALSRKKEMER